MKKIILLAIFVASEATASDNCGALLQDGIFNKYFSRTDYALIHEAKSIICEQYFRNKNDGTNLGVSIGSIDVSFGGNEVDSYGRVYCEDNYEFTEQTASDVNLQIMASNDVIQGYLACVEASSLGVYYDVSYQGTYSTSARIDVNVSQLANTRLPVFNGLQTYPQNALSCGFISANAPLPGENLTPGYYTIQCNQDETMNDSYVTIAFDTVPALSVPFSGKGDLKSNEYWELQNTISTSIEVQNERRRTWKDIPPVPLIDIEELGTTPVCVDIPEDVPSDAKEVALFAKVSTTRDHTKQIVFDFYTADYDNSYTQRLSTEIGGGAGQNRFYNSDNIWLPVTQDRRICGSGSANPSAYGIDGSLELTGYRL